MKRSLRIAALPLAVIALTLLASGCSKNSGDDSDAQGDKVQIVDGEVLLINSATPWTDRSLDVVGLIVVADRVDYRQFAMEFFVSGESSPELHAIVVENVGKKLRVRTERNQIVAAEEIEGTRFFEPASEAADTEVAANPTSDVTDAIDSQKEISLLTPEGKWLFYKSYENFDIYFEKVQDPSAEKKHRRMLQYSDKVQFRYPIYLEDEQRGWMAEAVADALVRKIEVDCTKTSISVDTLTYYLGLFDTLRETKSYSWGVRDPLFTPQYKYANEVSNLRQEFVGFTVSKGETEIWRDFFLSACSDRSVDTLPDEKTESIKMW
jgi:hypothetical protein